VAIGNSYFYRISGEVATMKEEINKLNMEIALLMSEVAHLNRIKRIEEKAYKLGFNYARGGEEIEILAIAVPNIYRSRIHTLSPLPTFLSLSIKERSKVEGKR